MNTSHTENIDRVHQADNRLPAVRPRSLWYPYPSLHFLSLFSLRIGKVSACSCWWTYSHWTGWLTGLGAATPVAPQGLEGSTPWRASYKVARSKQGVTASLYLKCSNTAKAELTTGSKTLPTGLTDLQVCAALIWRDKILRNAAKQNSLRCHSLRSASIHVLFISFILTSTVVWVGGHSLKKPFLLSTPMSGGSIHQTSARPPTGPFQALSHHLYFQLPSKFRWKAAAGEECQHV